MTAKEKINEAAYNLAKLKKADPRKVQFRYELSNFLCSTQSILYHLLAECNDKFGLGLVRVNYGAFLSKAKRLHHKKAINFINWYDGEYKKIKKNKQYGFLVEKRHISVHKRIVNPDLAETTTSTTYVDSSFGKKFKAASGTAILWGFSENPNSDVIDVCEMFFNRMKKVVYDAKRQT